MNRSRRQNERSVANQPDNALHLASAALGLYFGLAGRRTVASTA
jgi:hypothetical protein